MVRFSCLLLIFVPLELVSWLLSTGGAATADAFLLVFDMIRDTISSTSSPEEEDTEGNRKTRNTSLILSH
jgi:hypothetical protein